MTELDDEIVRAAADWARRIPRHPWSRERAQAHRTELAELGFFGLAVPEHAGGTGLGRSAVIGAATAIACADATLALEVALAGLGLSPLLDAVGDSEGLAALTAGAPTTGLAVPEGMGDGSRRLALFDTSHAFVEASPGRYARVDVTDPSETFIGLAGVDARPVDSPEVGTIEGPDATQVMRLALACAALGTAEAALAASIRYASERVQFNRPIRAFPAIEEKLVESHLSTRAARALLRDTIHGGDAHHAGLAATGAALLAAHHAIQVHGGYGYTTDYPVERNYRDAIALRAWLGAPHPDEPALFALG